MLIRFLDCFDEQKIYLVPWRVLGIDKYCYTTKFNFSLQKGFDWYCDYFLADCFIWE